MCGELIQRFWDFSSPVTYSAFTPVLLAEPDDQPEEDEFAEHEPEADQPEDQHDQRIDVACEGGSDR